MNKTFDLEERTYAFAYAIRILLKRLPKTIEYMEFSKQIIRSAGSVAANYIEANEAMSKKDFCHRIKISLKEIKETKFWLKMIRHDELTHLLVDLERLDQEAEELRKIFAAILNKCK